MNEILQKRIEEAADEYIETAIDSGENNFVDEGGMPLFDDDYVKYTYIEAATFALQNQWISVEEALPEENELVFGCVNDESTPQAIGMAYYDEYGGWHYSDEEEISLITHWMPIPSLEGGEE